MDFRTFLMELSEAPIRVVASDLDFSTYISIDLSVGNIELEEFDVKCSTSWIKYIGSYLKSHQKLIAFGGYLERRNMYDRSDYFHQSSSLKSRNIHLGIDFWCVKKTPVMAAFDGVIHSVADNTNHGDYGPTIVIKHYINNVIFYTLYGHLSRASIESLSKNTQITKGEVVGFIGSSEINGDYAPHLHFQIIKDIEHYEGDYPGVCSQADIEFYSNNCPDPNLVLKL
jgi:hypothetical protein